MDANPDALRDAYRNGRVNTGAGGLASIPIIDIRPYLDSLPDLHDRFRSFSTRARLRAANGNADNQVMFTVPTTGALFYDFNNPKSPYNVHGLEALELIDDWLGRISQDHAAGGARQKVMRNKPSGLADFCWPQSGEKLSGDRCQELFPTFGDPRTAAGSPLANNVLKCALKPVDPKDYTHPLTADQLARLAVVFPHGVCDYGRPGIGQQTSQEPWRKY
jgi:Tannase-like family of unknown function (DUF6351)